MAAGTDSDLAQFPRPSIAVDVAVMTVTDVGELGVLVHQRSGDRAGTWALPGRFVRDRERLASAVERTLEEKCGLAKKALAGRTPRQLHVFDEPARDDRGWVLSVAHLLVLPYARLAPFVTDNENLTIATLRKDKPVLPRGQRELPYGQNEIVERAHDELRREYFEVPDPERFIEADTFTLSELADVHFAILGKDHWAIDTFRRRMSRQLHETGELTKGGQGRPAAIFRRPRSRLD